VRATTLEYLLPLVTWHLSSPVNLERWSWPSPLRCSSPSMHRSFFLFKRPPLLLSASLSKGKLHICVRENSSLSGLHVLDGLASSSSRNQSCESEYLSAGSRLLSAACIPQPKLIVHYTAVNSSQEQVFRLDVSTARRWLRHNHLWAGEVWTH